MKVLIGEVEVMKDGMCCDPTGKLNNGQLERFNAQKAVDSWPHIYRIETRRRPRKSLAQGLRLRAAAGKE